MSWHVTGGDRLNWFAGLQPVDHVPDAVGFAALDDLEWGGVIEGGVGGLEPFADIGGVHDLSKGVEAIWVYLKCCSHGLSSPWRICQARSSILAG